MGKKSIDDIEASYKGLTFDGLKPVTIEDIQQAAVKKKMKKKPKGNQSVPGWFVIRK